MLMSALAAAIGLPPAAAPGRRRFEQYGEMTGSYAQNSGKSIFRNWRYAIGWLLAAAGLIWVLHDIHPSKLAGQLAGIDWRWVALAMVCDVLSYVVQAVRWQLLLEPVGRIGLLQATQAIYAGLFTNEVLPMRPGEFRSEER